MFTYKISVRFIWSFWMTAEEHLSHFLIVAFQHTQSRGLFSNRPLLSAKGRPCLWWILSLHFFHLWPNWCGLSRWWWCPYQREGHWTKPATLDRAWVPFAAYLLLTLPSGWSPHPGIPGCGSIFCLKLWGSLVALFFCTSLIAISVTAVGGLEMSIRAK